MHSKDYSVKRKVYNLDVHATFGAPRLLLDNWPPKTRTPEFSSRRRRRREETGWREREREKGEGGRRDGRRRAKRMDARLADALRVIWGLPLPSRCRRGETEICQSGRPGRTARVKLLWPRRPKRPMRHDAMADRQRVMASTYSPCSLDKAQGPAGQRSSLTASPPRPGPARPGERKGPTRAPARPFRSAAAATPGTSSAPSSRRWSGRSP